MNRLEAKRAGYETLYVYMSEDAPIVRSYRLTQGAAPSVSEEFISDDWLHAFGKPEKNEPFYPYQDRDARDLRMFGA